MHSAEHILNQTMVRMFNCGRSFSNHIEKKKSNSKNDAEKEYNLTKLPAEAGDTIRIIKIGDYDACPCSGLHVSHTKEIGRFKIISTGYNDGKLRLRFKLFDS
jgi:Ser-tRNA(Ala) deacylase AlaX